MSRRHPVEGAPGSLGVVENDLLDRGHPRFPIRIQQFTQPRMDERLGLLAKTDTVGRLQTTLRNRFLIRGSVLSIVLGNLQVVGTGFVVADFLSVVFDNTLEHSSYDHAV
jgi:hypothetical protein